MDAYIYRAALYCEDDAKQITLDRYGMTLCSTAIAESINSEDTPQGPYADGGGKADSPQHCDACGVFLENPLTDDGREYVLDAVNRYDFDASGQPDVINAWREFYETDDIL